MTRKKDNVVILPVITRLNLPVDRILKAALAENLSEVVVCGFDAEGKEYFASSQASGADVLWHLERTKHNLMRVTDEMTA